MPNPFQVGDRVRRINAVTFSLVPNGTEWIVQSTSRSDLIGLENDPSGPTALRSVQYFELVERPIVEQPQEEITLYTVIYKINLHNPPRSRGFDTERDALDTKNSFELAGYHILGMKKIKVRI